MKLLKEYIRQLVEQHSNNIIQAIVKKFPADFAAAPAPAPWAGRARALAAGKQNAFWQKYNADAAFRKLMRETYCYNKRAYFDFWLNSLELKEFLREDLKSAEMIVIEGDKASAVSLSDVSAALEIAENVEEFEEMVGMSIIAEQHVQRKTIIIQESIERRLKINTIISKASKIIMQEMKELIKDNNDRVSFIITKDKIPELSVFAQPEGAHKVLFFYVTLTSSALRVDNVSYEGEYDDVDNKIYISASFNKQYSQNEKYLSPTIMKLQDTLRHELEHAIQVLKKQQQHVFSAEYHLQQHEIEAYAVELYRRILRRANKLKQSLQEIAIIQVVNNFVEHQFSYVNHDERDEVKRRILDYMMTRFPLIKKMDWNKI